MESPVNPWVRTDLEKFNVETLALIPQGQQQEYITVMKELAHARAIAALVLEQMFQKEQARAAFFEPFINTKASEEAVCAIVIDGTDPDYNTKTPAEEHENSGRGSPDYTPVTDLNEYRDRRG